MSRKHAYVYFYASYCGKFHHVRDSDIVLMIYHTYLFQIYKHVFQYIFLFIFDQIYPNLFCWSLRGRCVFKMNRRISSLTSHKNRKKILQSTLCVYSKIVSLDRHLSQCKGGKIYLILLGWESIQKLSKKNQALEQFCSFLSPNQIICFFFLYANEISNVSIFQDTYCLVTGLQKHHDPNTQNGD